LAAIIIADRAAQQGHTVMHKFLERTGFDRKIQSAEFDQLVMSEVASQKLAESHVGLSHGEY
jgi:p-hydroxybenzoate 3-monooxygenase